MAFPGFHPEALYLRRGNQCRNDCPGDYPQRRKAPAEGLSPGELRRCVQGLHSRMGGAFRLPEHPCGPASPAGWRGADAGAASGAWRRAGRRLQRHGACRSLAGDWRRRDKSSGAGRCVFTDCRRGSAPLLSGGRRCAGQCLRWRALVSWRAPDASLDAAQEVPPWRGRAGCRVEDRHLQWQP